MEDLKIHECDKLPAQGVQIIYDNGYSTTDDPIWQLTIGRCTTEQDLMENCDYEEVGETIWQTIIEISYCPYCGDSLYEEGHKVDANHGQFYHFGGG